MPVWASKIVKTNTNIQVTYGKEYIRTRRNKRVTAILDEFADLNRLDAACRPVFWKMLRCRHGMKLHCWKNWMLSFVLADSVVSYHLSRWRIATSVESIERAKGAGCTVDVLSLGRFNLEVMSWPNVCDKFSVQCCTTMSLIEPTCRNVLLTMLPKSRDSTQPNYCRPIVVLKFTTKMLSKLLYGRPRATLHMEQCFDEIGFTPHIALMMQWLMQNPNDQIIRFFLPPNGTDPAPRPHDYS